MEYQSCFDIIGPIMVGPSSSHTAGVVLIGKFIYELIGERPEEVNIIFYDSFAETYQGHGTDKAILGGLLGMNTDDFRIKYASSLMKQYGIKVTFHFEDTCPYYEHPNTTVVTTKLGNYELKVGGVSLGGGVSKIFMINGEKMDIRLSTSVESSKFVSCYSSYLMKEKV
ncbi:MAG TPA: serine dehydratase beta chain [Metabacillus sp.]|nr:serine dehydratase beta chain [Metabacillus sp.]